MISSIFGKTKPINFIFIAIFLFLYFWGVLFFLFDLAFSGMDFLKQLGIVVALLLSCFLVDFISKKNELSKSTTYPILLFTLLLCMYPQIFKSGNFILSNFFILMAIRRLLSLRNNHSIKQKLFDATLYIGIAFFWYQWSLIFIVLVYAAIVLYDAKDYKNWFVPLVGIGTILFLTLCYYVLTDNITAFISLFDFNVQYSVEKYKNASFSVPIVSTLIIGVIAIFSYLVNMKIRAANAQKAMALIVGALLLGIIISAFSEDVNVAELIFMAFPLAMIISNYLQIVSSEWWKEAVLWIFISLPFLALVL